MHRPTRRTRTLVASLAALVLVATVAVFSTAGTSAPTAAQQQYGPTNTAPPTLTGEERQGATLTTSNGSWTSTTTITYTYAWQRCEANGTGCADIAGATANRYVVQAADVGKRLRSRVTARNTTGSSTAFSALTGVITAGAEGQIRLPSGLISVPASAVALPARLVISDVQYSQMPIRSRNPLQMRVRVKDSRGFVVRDALVYSTAVPFGRITQPGEVRTDQEGWATLTITPTRLLPLANGYLLTQFVRARKEGDDVLAGVSTRRLVSVRTARPTG
jgi:hypothetical protein